jgi:DNA-binding CsgD family transcriptional regulator/transposase-like protein/5-methylcytosine-specific restriction endonuclease McrA
MSNMAAKKYRDKEWLKHQLEQADTLEEISKKCTCNAGTISKWAEKFGLRGKENQTPDDTKYRDSNWLLEQYQSERKTVAEIADECSVHPSTIRHWMKKHSIPRRSHGPDTENGDIHQNKDWLRKHYKKHDKTLEEIASLAGVSIQTVQYHLEKHGLENSDITDDIVRMFEDGLSPGEIADCKTLSENRVKTHLAKAGVTSYYNYPNTVGDKSWLRQKHHDEEMSVPEIADVVGCKPRLVYRHIQYHNLQLNRVEYAQDFSYGSGWNESKRKAVRKRDGNQCVRCSMSNQEHINKWGNKLHVHHIEKARDIEDPEERNSKQNLVTLCQDCHILFEKLADSGLLLDFR